MTPIRSARRFNLRITLLVVLPVAGATWILGMHTIGTHLAPQGDDSGMIGFACALLVVALSCSMLLGGVSPGNQQLATVLIICGTCCIVAAVALQIYLASITAENGRRILEILGERVRTNPSANLNLNADYPKTVQAVSYLAMMAGVGLAAFGAWAGLGTSNAASPKDGSVPRTG